MSILDYIDYSEILSTIWSVILIPIITYIGTLINNYIKERQVDKYTKVLYDEAKKAVKAVYQSIVEDIKGTEGWTDERKFEVKMIAKSKVLQALPSKGIKLLKEANDDFDSYIDNLVEAALYEVKKEGRAAKGPSPVIVEAAPHPKVENKPVPEQHIEAPEEKVGHKPEPEDTEETVG